MHPGHHARWRRRMNWVGLLGVGVLLLDLGKPGLLRRGRPGGEGPPGKARESGL